MVAGIRHGWRKNVTSRTLLSQTHDVINGAKDSSVPISVHKREPVCHKGNGSSGDGPFWSKKASNKPTKVP